MAKADNEESNDNFRCLLGSSYYIEPKSAEEAQIMLQCTARLETILAGGKEYIALTGYFLVASLIQDHGRHIAYLIQRYPHFLLKLLYKINCRN